MAGCACDGGLGDACGDGDGGERESLSHGGAGTELSVKWDAEGAEPEV